MHEASLAQGLLNLITDSVSRYNEAHPENQRGALPLSALVWDLCPAWKQKRSRDASSFFPKAL